MSGEKLAELKKLAVAHHQAGRFAEAAAAYQQVLEQAPKDVDALHLLGLLAHQSGQVLDGWRKLDERPFDFERRRVSVLAEQAGERVEIVKGAPETVLILDDVLGSVDDIRSAFVDIQAHLFK